LVEPQPWPRWFRIWMLPFLSATRNEQTPQLSTTSSCWPGHLRRSSKSPRSSRHVVSQRQSTFPVWKRRAARRLADPSDATLPNSDGWAQMDQESERENYSMWDCCRAERFPGSHEPPFSGLLGTDRGVLFHGSAGGGRWLAGGQRGAGVSVSVGLFSVPWPDASLWNLKGWLCPVLAAWARPTSARIRCFQRASRNLLCTRSHGAINQSGVCAPSITSTPVSRIFLSRPGTGWWRERLSGRQ